MMEKKYYDKRIIPFVRHEEKIINWKIYTITTENLTHDEIKSMSCNPRMLNKNNGHIYLTEIPLLFNEGSSIKYLLCFIYDELSEKEQKKYFNRSILISITCEKIGREYDKISKNILSKKRKN